ncbi:MAG: hypothetical protein H7144_11895 [Burkholderiales bacterium]|nr:hypothetical protein [Phycisphaerae bacterium]
MQSLQRGGIVLSVIVALLSAQLVRADAAGAQNYVTEAKALVERQDYDGAKRKLELAEAELEGVDAAAKAPVQKLVDDLKKQMSDAQLAVDRQKYTRELERLVTKAEEAVGNMVVWPGAAAAITELFNNPQAKAALGDELTKAQAKFATFQKLHAKKASTEFAAELDAEMKKFEEEWTLNKAKITKPADDNEAGNAISNTGQAIRRLNDRLAQSPADDEKVKTTRARLAAVTEELTKFEAGLGAAKLAERLRSWADGYARDWEGWESENTAPTWDEYKGTGSASMDRFKAEKSSAAVSRLTSILEEVQKQDDFKEFGATAVVKAELDKIKAQRDAAYAKVLKNATTVVEGAEKATVDSRANDTYGRLKDGVRVSLGETPESAKLQARVEALAKKFADQTAGETKAAEELVAKLTAGADKAWPDMVGKFSTKDGFDPSSAKSGEYYRIKDGANRMGWDFKPESGGFEFAMKVGGQPVAGTYDSTVRSAIEEIQKKTNRTIEDRGWDFVVLYEGKQGKLQQFREGSVQTTGGEQVGTYRETQTVDAPIVKVVALHVGPLAVAQGQGAVKEDGAVAAPTGDSGVVGAASTGSGWLRRVLYLLVGLVAAFVCLVKARFAPLASVAQVGQVQASVGDQNLSYVGLACAALGAVWLLTSLIGLSFFGILLSLAITAAGLYAGLDVLLTRGLVKQEMAAKIKPLGVPIGLTCAALVLLSLFI